MLKNLIKSLPFFTLGKSVDSLFFDKLWWKNNFNTIPPGLVGAGNGLGLYPADGGYKSSIAYTIKNPDTSMFNEVPQEGI